MLGLIRTELISQSEPDVGQIYLTEQIPRGIRNLPADRFQSNTICNEAWTKVLDRSHKHIYLKGKRSFFTCSLSTIVYCIFFFNLCTKEKFTLKVVLTCLLLVKYLSNTIYLIMLIIMIDLFLLILMRDRAWGEAGE